MLFKTLTLCAVVAISVSLTAAQQNPDSGDHRKILDNFDVAPHSANPAGEKPANPSAQDNSDPEHNSVNRRGKLTRKKAVLKTATVAPKADGEGYWPGDPAPASEAAPAPPAPKIYSELHTAIDDSGKLMLTSDTIIIKPDIKEPPTSLTSNESTGKKELDDIIQESARKNKVDPRLILEVMRQESGFHTSATSNKGARGLMQLIPSTAARFGVYHIYDPKENVEAGTRYLRFLLDTFKGNVELALAGYNAGEYAVIRNNFKVPHYRETQDYVRSITARYRSKYHQFAIGKTEAIVVHQVPIATFEAENGRLILSNNY